MDESEQRSIPCKMGSQPRSIILYRGYKIREGLIITFRYERERHRWQKATIYQVMPIYGNYFKAVIGEHKLNDVRGRLGLPLR